MSSSRPALPLPLADGLWLLRFPLTLAGCHLGRNVTVIRLTSGKLVIHSTAPFSEQDVTTIKDLGTPLEENAKEAVDTALAMHGF